MMDILGQMIYGNKLSAWLLAGGIFLLALLGLLIARRLFELHRKRLAQQQRSELNQLGVDLAARTRLLFLLILALYISAASLALPDRLASWLRLLVIISVLLQVAIWGLCLIDFLLRRRLRSDRGARTTVNILSLLAKIALWTIIVLLILENITGIQVDTLIASLGIGGIAVALALQHILGDIFASLTIVLDKPFVVGDTIQVGEFTGTVEHIGLNSTRLHSSGGEQLIFSNSDLLNSRIRNLQRLQNRPVVFSFNVPYSTPPEKLAHIPALVAEVIQGQTQVSFDRAHLRELGSFAMRYECAFTVQSADLLTYLDAQQAIFLGLAQRLADEGMAFAASQPTTSQPGISQPGIEIPG